MENEIRGFIFDLDGVLVFTDQYHYQAWKMVSNELGVYFDESINNCLRGVGRMESLDIILERCGKNLSSEEKRLAVERKNDIYKKLLQQMSPEAVDDEVRETLKKLKDRGFCLAVGSSSKNAKYILQRTNLAEMFDAISDGTNISKTKPNPEVFVKAAESMKLLAKECIVVEDACAGIQAAKAAGMWAVGIGNAEEDVEADYVVMSFCELLDL